MAFAVAKAAVVDVRPVSVALETVGAAAHRLGVLASQTIGEIDEKGLIHAAPMGDKLQVLQIWGHHFPCINLALRGSVRRRRARKQNTGP